MTSPRDVIDYHPVLLETKNLTKRFQNVVANDNVSLNFRKGEIHCLLGENGAGKTTLAECIYGFYRIDSGEIHYKGKKVDLTSPSHAVKLGIGMVHQHFVLIRPFSVIENIAISSLEKKFLLDLTPTKKKMESLCEKYGIKMDLNAKIWQLSVGEQQWVEILKAVFNGVELLILDEPTAALTPKEVDKLFVVLQQMKEQGLSVIFVTHKLQEVIKFSDRVSVLRKGKFIDTFNTSDVTQEQLARKMVGRDVVLQITKKRVPIGEPFFELVNLSAANDRGQEGLRGASFKLHKGEILGFAGVAGNGQKELFEVLAGVRKIQAGEILFNGKSIKNQSPAEIRKRGVAHIPDDRINEGLIMDFTVAENLILGSQRDLENRKGIFLNRNQILINARNLIQLFSIVPPTPTTQTKHLSGGNLQKVILARELNRKLECVIANQPTRGLDVGVIEYIHKRLLDLRKEHVGILLFSEDLDELFALSDRIAVMYCGKIIRIFNTLETNMEEIGLCMAGIDGKMECSNN